MLSNSGRSHRRGLRREMLEIKNLTLGYSRHPIVHHLNMSVADGEMLAVIGPNGGGKSTR